MSADRGICRDCGWVGPWSEVLVAPSPFNPAYEITGCPDCQEAETIRVACDEYDCRRESTCGTPTDVGGYRRTCGEHRPAAAGDREAK